MNYYNYELYIIRDVAVCACHSRQTDDDQIRSVCGALAVVRHTSHWIITINGKINVWKCKVIFLLTH